MNLLPQLLKSKPTDTAPAPVATREGETMHRLQVGLLGLGGMVLLVGVADMIMDRAQQSEDEAVAEAAPAVEPSEEPAATGALENAGVVPEAADVPDIPDDVEEEPVPQGPVLPEQGDVGGPQGD